MSDLFEQKQVLVDLAGLDFPLSVLIDEIDAEIKMRNWVYPKRVAAKKMTPASASRKISKMQNVRAALVRLKEAAET